MTNNQTVIYVLLNFGLALILLSAVNSNVDTQCAVQLKYWLVIFALILAGNSLIQVTGIDIER
jgi:hypothetical protein